uniref:Ribonuclease H protein At1g65750 family n=1 Tax=Cajanus cajan TaxID=3821 RepID=A0A151SNW9_CAJCA|nr:Putative ribonuclease H protein At1g65750 family [Cajanus cajan]
MTNEARFGRDLTTSPICPICMQDVENTMHVLRDCIFARQVWSSIPRGSCISQPTGSNFQEWLIFHLTRSRTELMNWPLSFAITIDALWNRRNEVVFQQSSLSASQLVLKVTNCAKSIINSSTPFDAGAQSDYTRITRNWVCPPSGFIKLNGDGAVFIFGDKLMWGFNSKPRWEVHYGILKKARPLLCH